MNYLEVIGTDTTVTINLSTWHPAPPGSIISPLHTTMISLLVVAKTGTPRLLLKIF